MTFSKTEGIALHFVGNNKEEIYDFAFSTAKEPYSMTIKLSNINVKTELAQYGYDGKEVSYEGGLLNMDLTIASSGMSGWIAFDGVDVKYIDLDEKIKEDGKVAIYLATDSEEVKREMKERYGDRIDSGDALNLQPCAVTVEKMDNLHVKRFLHQMVGSLWHDFGLCCGQQNGALLR